MTIWILICSTRPSADANGVRRSKTLLGTIKTSWTNIAHKLDTIDHTTGSWKPGTHPFNQFKYIKYPKGDASTKHAFVVFQPTRI